MSPSEAETLKCLRPYWGGSIEAATFIPLTVRAQVRASNLKVLATFEERRKPVAARRTDLSRAGV